MDCGEECNTSVIAGDNITLVCHSAEPSNVRWDLKSNTKYNLDTLYSNYRVSPQHIRGNQSVISVTHDHNKNESHLHIANIATWSARTYMCMNGLSGQSTTVVRVVVLGTV